MGQKLDFDDDTADVQSFVSNKYKAISEKQNKKRLKQEEKERQRKENERKRRKEEAIKRYEEQKKEEEEKRKKFPRVVQTETEVKPPPRKVDPKASPKAAMLVSKLTSIDPELENMLVNETVMSCT